MQLPNVNCKFLWSNIPVALAYLVFISESRVVKVKSSLRKFWKMPSRVCRLFKNICFIDDDGYVLFGVSTIPSSVLRNDLQNKTQRLVCVHMSNFTGTTCEAEPVYLYIYISIFRCIWDNPCLFLLELCYSVFNCERWDS